MKRYRKFMPCILFILLLYVVSNLGLIIVSPSQAFAIAASNSQMQLPYKDPTNASLKGKIWKVKTKFGEKYKYGIHTGVDWSLAPGNDDAGEPIYPIAPGVVINYGLVSKDSDPEFGEFIIIRHEGDFWISEGEYKYSKEPIKAFYSVYMHLVLDRRYKTIGMQITKSDLQSPIGKIKKIFVDRDNDGKIDKEYQEYTAHLHFEIRHPDVEGTDLEKKGGKGYSPTSQEMVNKGYREPTSFLDWNINNPTPNVKTPMNTVFVLDCSGSMSENTDDGRQKLAAAQTAVRHYLDLIEFDTALGADHQVGLVAFGSTVSLVSPLMTDLAMVRSNLDSLDPTTRTDFGDALDEALKLIEKAPPERRSGKKLLILLSDGMTNEGPVEREGFLVGSAEEFAGPLRLYQRAQEEQIQIFTIGFGVPMQNIFTNNEEGLDEPVLKAIARAPGTGGEYLRAADASELDRIYSRNFHESTGILVLESLGVISQGQQKKIVFNLKSAQSRLTATAGQRLKKGWSGLGSMVYAAEPVKNQMLVTLGWSKGRLGLQLKDPNGRIINSAYSGARFQDYQQLICIAIDSPGAGNWTAEITGDEIAEGESRYNLLVSARLPRQMAFSGSGVGYDEIGVETLLVIVIFGGIILLGAVCVVLIRRRRLMTVAVGNAPLAWLQVYQPSVSPQNVSICKMVVRIGRGTDNDVILADPEVSTVHAEARLHTKGILVLDLQSTNGLWFNGQKTKSALVRHREWFQIGATRIVYYNVE